MTTIKATGIVRNVDNLDRVVIPKELCRTLGIGPKTALEIFVDNEGSIILKKYEPACTFCGEASNTVTYRERIVCKNCLKEMSELK